MYHMHLILTFAHLSPKWNYKVHPIVPTSTAHNVMQLDPGSDSANYILLSLSLVILNSNNAASAGNVGSPIDFHRSRFKWSNSESSIARRSVKHIVCN